MADKIRIRCNCGKMHTYRYWKMCTESVGILEPNPNNADIVWNAAIDHCMMLVQSEIRMHDNNKEILVYQMGELKK